MIPPNNRSQTAALSELERRVQALEDAVAKEVMNILLNLQPGSRATLIYRRRAYGLLRESSRYPYRAARTRKGWSRQ